SEPAERSASRGLTDIEDALSGDAYWRAAAWKKVAVIFAGPGTNLVFAVLLLAAVFMLGVPDERTRTVDRITAGSPAAGIGLESGDEIVAVEGRPTEGFDAVSREIRGSNGSPIPLTVFRDGRQVSLGPAQAEKAEDGRYVIGFVPSLEYRRYGPADATWQAIAKTWEVTAAIGGSLGRIVTGSGREEVSSPVGIVQGSSQALDLGFRYYLGVLALISLSLALLNLLPLLPLDGGHIAFSILEKLRGRAIPREAYERFSAVGIALVLMLFFIGLSNDIGRLGGT
ncbi:MAG: site-2 protease family protein, partial [Gaiellaceae bacterium]